MPCCVVYSVASSFYTCICIYIHPLCSSSPSLTSRAQRVTTHPVHRDDASPAKTEAHSHHASPGFPSIIRDITCPWMYNASTRPCLCPTGFIPGGVIGWELPITTPCPAMASGKEFLRILTLRWLLASYSPGIEYIIGHAETRRKLICPHLWDWLVFA